MALCIFDPFLVSVFFHYIIPAMLYTLYNNLAFVSLANFDPTTYMILLQLRIVFVGIAFQVSLVSKLLTTLRSAGLSYTS